jgi:hypothetical protein
VWNGESSKSVATLFKYRTALSIQSPVLGSSMLNIGAIVKRSDRYARHFLYVASLETLIPSILKV